MDYKNIVFLIKDTIKAVDVDLEGNCDIVSLNGHESISYKTAQDIKVFCDCLKDAYNIDEFSDLDIETLVIYSKVKSDMMFAVYELLKECKQINVIDMEKLLPIIAEKKGLLSAEGKTLVEFSGMYYQLSCDAEHTVQVRFVKASEDNCVHLQNEDFNVLYYYKNRVSISAEATKKIETEYQSQMEALKQEFAAVEEKLNREKVELLNEIREYEARLVAKEEEEKRNSFKRIVYKLDYNQAYTVWISKYCGDIFLYQPEDCPDDLDDGYEHGYEKKTMSLREVIKRVKDRNENFLDEEYKDKYLGVSIEKYYKDSSLVTKGTVVGIIENSWYSKSRGGLFGMIANTAKIAAGRSEEIEAFKNERVKLLEIKAEMDGKIYWIDNHGEYLQDQDDYLILIENDDTKADAIEWYKESKQKEAEENEGTF